MKGYRDYMNSITVDSSLHEKIMNRVMEKNAPQRRSRHIYVFAGIAACMALLVFGFWTVSNLRNYPGSNNGVNGVHEGYVIHEPSEPVQNGDKEIVSPPLVLHALTFNVVESVMSARMMIPDGYFDYNLTDEQLTMVFPNLDLDLYATAHYRNDGTLWFVTASEYEWNGARRNFTWTTISLGNEGIMPDSTLLFPEDSPIISDVHGVLVTAFVFGMNDEHFRADFALNGITYRIETSDIPAIRSDDGERNGMERLTELVNKIIVNDAADLSVLADPVIPELRNEGLTLAEARLEADFGAFLPHNIPAGFTFESAHRLVNTRDNSLFTSWSSGFDFISWHVRTPLESDLWDVVSVNDREKFDVSLYTTPWFGSVPPEFHYYFQSPVFLAEEFTLDVVTARTRFVDSGRRDIVPRWETAQFGVLFGDVLVVVNMTGISPEEIWEMFQGS